MIEIVKGTLEEQVIKLLQEIYPITISDIEEKLRVSRGVVERVLQKFQVKGIVQLEPLPGKTYVRLLRDDFSFVGKKRQRRFIKHYYRKKKQGPKDYEGIMYS
jgi:DNA-binding transcriptional regulator GbsR (MarR family)